jgi:glyoxylase-like metal-dependent hydrolase (beta-lactamase superfamily II)
MRALALHADVLVATSAIWQTNCVVVRADEESFILDSPVLPDELEALPTLIEQAGFPAPSGLLATHADWDHLLGRLAYPELALGCAESTAAWMEASPGEAQRELRAFDEEHFIARARPLALGALQALPVPGSCGIGERELDLHPAPGHTGDGMAITIGWAGVLVTGDYLSPVELPVLGPAGSAEVYADTLVRLRALVQRSEYIVPGHGRVLDPEQALQILDEDLSYVRDPGPSSSTRLRRSSRSARPPRSERPR